MILGALLDLGLPLKALEGELRKIPLEKFELAAKKVKRAQIAATKFEVSPKDAGPPRAFPEITSLIDASSLDASLKKRGKQIFQELAEAEAKIHGENLEKVQFHEVGALDSVVDIMGAVIALDLMNIEQAYASPVAVAESAPATLEILKDTPVYGRTLRTEIATPTGAAIIKVLARKFGPLPPLRIAATGYGAGTKKLKTPNVLRIILGEQEEIDFEEVSLLESNIDNTNPQFFERVLERLFEAGALDVWMNPIYMKKSRPAVTVSVLCPLGLEPQLVEIMMEETDTLGVRLSPRRRQKALSRLITVETKYGEVQVKIGEFKKKVVSVAPEYDFCLRLAKKHGLPLKRVFEEAKTRAKESLQTHRGRQT